MAIHLFLFLVCALLYCPQHDSLCAWGVSVETGARPVHGISGRYINSGLPFPRRGQETRTALPLFYLPSAHPPHFLRPSHQFLKRENLHECVVRPSSFSSAHECLLIYAGHVRPDGGGSVEDYARRGPGSGTLPKPVVRSRLAWDGNGERGVPQKHRRRMYIP